MLKKFPWLWLIALFIFSIAPACAQQTFPVEPYLGGSTLSVSTSTALTDRSPSYIFVNTASTNVTITLPAANSLVAKAFLISFVSTTGSGQVVINTAGSDTYVGTSTTGASSVTLASPGQLFGVLNNGSNHWGVFCPSIASTLRGGTGLSFSTVSSGNIFAGPILGSSAAAPTFRNADPGDFGSSINQGKVLAGPATGGSGPSTFRSLVLTDLPGGSGTGSVTSINIVDSTGLFAITGGPITTSGSITLSSFNTQSAHKWFGVSGGSTAAPGFNTIGLSDLPTTVVSTGQSNTYTAGTQDMSAAAAVDVPTVSTGTNNTNAASSAFVANTFGSPPALGSTTPAAATVTQLNLGNSNTLQSTSVGLFEIDNGTVGTLGGFRSTTHSTRQILPVSSVTVTPTGTPGSTTYDYVIEALALDGSSAGASTAGVTSTGNASLGSLNYNALSWSAPSGAYKFNVYRTVGGATQGLITTTASTSYNDQGAAGNGALCPSGNSTGQLSNGVAGGNKDLGFTRNASGVWEIDNGTAGFWGELKANSVSLQTLTTPSAPTVTPTGGSASTWSYVVVPKTASGAYFAPATAVGTTTTGAATLTGSAYNTITVPQVAGASSYDFYRTVHATSPTTLGKIGNVAMSSTSSTVSLVDTGLAGDSTTAPSTNTTGTLAANNITSTNPINLASGGTNANLTANAGAVPYSTSSGIALNTPAGSAGIPFLSGTSGTGTPTFGALNLAGGTSVVTGVLPSVNLPAGLGSFIPNSKSSSFSAVSENCYFVTATATCTLPTAVGIGGQEIVVVNAGSGTVTFNTTSGQTISLQASGAISTSLEGDVYRFISDGSNFWAE